MVDVILCFMGWRKEEEEEEGGGEEEESVALCDTAFIPRNKSVVCKYV